MNKKIGSAGIRPILAACALCIALSVPPATANPLGGQIPQIPAFLPLSTDVPMTEKMPIDGEWMVSTIKKRIRIEGGRAYAVDPWVHLFVLKVEPLMVVIRDMKRTGPRQYTGQDLPLMGQFTAEMQTDGTLRVTVAGALGPVKYNLIPVRVDDQYSFDLEKSGQYVAPYAQPGYPATQPGYPQQQPGYPAAQPGYPQQQPGYPAAQPGYPQQQPVQPVAQPGYPQPQPVQPVTQPGYGQQPGAGGVPVNPDAGQPPVSPW